jgi:hypothetical protein
MKDSKLEDLIKQKRSKSRKKLEKSEKYYESEIDEDLHNVKKVMGKK